MVTAGIALARPAAITRSLATLLIKELSLSVRHGGMTKITPYLQRLIAFVAPS